MASMFGMYQCSRKDTRKAWRYPGVPIPFRLQSKYKVVK